MSDIALVWDPVEGASDFAVEDNDLATDDSFETSIYLSLFCDAAALPGDVIPVELGSRRGGWWADQLSPIPGDRFGSRLWLLRRQKESQIILTRGREYAAESLEWMITDRVAEQVVVTTDFYRKGWLRLVPTIHRPKLDPISFRYDYNWRTQAARRA